MLEFGVNFWMALYKFGVIFEWCARLVGGELLQYWQFLAYFNRFRLNFGLVIIFLGEKYLFRPWSTLRARANAPRLSKLLQRSHLTRCGVFEIVSFVTIEVPTHSIQLVSKLGLSCYFEHASSIPC